MIAIKFPDFKRFVEETNKRIYYYQIDNIVNLYFVSEGLIFKSFVDLRSIGSAEAFFAHKIFLGATELLFPIQDINDSQKPISASSPPTEIIKQVMPVETKSINKDLQKEGVDIQHPGA